MPIMTAGQLLARARKYTDDLISPYFTTDEDMYLYLSEAERDLAVSGELLRDIRNYRVTADMRWLSLKTDPELLEIRTAVLINSSDQRWDLFLRGTMDQPPAMDTAYDDYGAMPSSSQLVRGRPQIMSFGKRANYAELIPYADAAYTIEATVVLYPASTLAASGDVPSIPERHHAAIAVGAALKSLDATRHEFAPQKIQNLDIVWQRALLRAAEEAGRVNRDSSTVKFNNDMWT
jgi:hypothetical protein